MRLCVCIRVGRAWRVCGALLILCIGDWRKQKSWWGVGVGWCIFEYGEMEEERCLALWSSTLGKVLPMGIQGEVKIGVRLGKASRKS